MASLVSLCCFVVEVGFVFGGFASTQDIVVLKLQLVDVCGGFFLF